MTLIRYPRNAYRYTGYRIIPALPESLFIEITNKDVPYCHTIILFPVLVQIMFRSGTLYIDPVPFLIPEVLS